MKLSDPIKIDEFFHELKRTTGDEWKPEQEDDVQPMLGLLAPDVSSWPQTTLDAPDFPFRATFAAGEDGKRRQVLGDEVTPYGVESVVALVNGFRFMVRFKGVKTRLDLKWEEPVMAKIYDALTGKEVDRPLDSHERARTLEPHSGDLLVIGRRS